MNEYEKLLARADVALAQLVTEFAVALKKSQGELEDLEKERKHWEILATNTKTDLEYATRKTKQVKTRS